MTDQIACYDWRPCSGDSSAMKRGGAVGKRPTGTSASVASAATTSKKVCKDSGSAGTKAKREKDKSSILTFKGRDTVAAVAKALAKTSVDPTKQLKGSKCVCRRCRAKAADGVPWGQCLEKSGASKFAADRVPIDDACEACWCVYQQGDYEIGDNGLQQVDDECCEDPTKNEEFDMAVKLRDDGSVKPWLPQIMSVARRQMVVAKISHRGLRPDEFEIRFQGKKPADLGYKLQDLVHPDQSVYKGVLLRDDGSFGCLGVCYEFSTDIATIIEEHKVRGAHYLRGFFCNS